MRPMTGPSFEVPDPAPLGIRRYPYALTAAYVINETIMRTAREVAIKQEITQPYPTDSLSRWRRFIGRSILRTSVWLEAKRRKALR